MQTPLSQVPNDQPVTATCPAGKTALGGGGEAQGESSALGKSYPIAAGTGQGNKWVVAGRASYRTTVGIVGYVVCADPVPDITVTRYTRTSTMPVGGYLSCLDTQRVVGGGASSNGPETVLFASRPGLKSEGLTRDGWWVQAAQSPNYYNQTFSADLYVMCMPR